MSRPAPISFWSRYRSASLLVAGVITIGLMQVMHVFGDQLGNRSLELSDATPSATALYSVSFDNLSGSVGSIDIQFCSNDPVPASACTAPNGFDASSSSLSSQTGATGFVISPTSTANDLILTRIPSAASGSANYTFSGVMNPSSVGTEYVRLQTYASNDASGPATGYGGLAFAINNLLSVSAKVPPYLLFCLGSVIPSLDCSSASGNYINFGELNSNFASSGQTQLLAATNAASGYNIRVNGTTLTSGNNTLSPIINDISRPGTSQFGINLRVNSSPNVGADPAGPGVGAPTAPYGQQNIYRFNPGEVIASTPTVDEVREYTVSYIVNVSQTQPAGVYATTLTYICLANF